MSGYGSTCYAKPSLPSLRRLSLIAALASSMSSVLAPPARTTLEPSFGYRPRRYKFYEYRNPTDNGGNPHTILPYPERVRRNRLNAISRASRRRNRRKDWGSQAA